MTRIHRLSVGFLSSAVLAVVLMSGMAGCGGSGDPGLDAGNDSGPEDTPVDKSQSITFINPDPASRKLINGKFKAEFKYEDALGLAATLSVGFVKQPGFVPIVIEAPKPGTYSVELDTTLVLEGNRSIEVTAVATDQRTISARGKVLVDNMLPLISFLEPMPESGSNFMGDLVVRVKVQDEGNKVHSVKITAGDFTWDWPPEDGTTSDVVDTRVTTTVEGVETHTDLVIPTLGWEGGNVIVKVVADDGVPGHKTEMTSTVTFVETPGFVGGENLPLPTGSSGSVIAGIRTGPADDGIWGVAVAELDGISLYRRSGASVLENISAITAENCTRFVVAMMDQDDYDDVVAFCGSAETRRIVVVRQNEDLTFSELVSIPIDYDVINLTTGLLNGDDFRDIAFTTTDDTYSTGIILSTATPLGDLDSWGEAGVYSGAISPEYVAIGQFASDNRNSVVVGNPVNPQVTIFPVNSQGIATTGENSTLDPQYALVKGVTSLAAVNFVSATGNPNVLIYTDTTDEETIGAATLDTNSYRVQKRDFWMTGLDPKDIVVGDIDGNNVPDVAVLCAGANMVQVFFGNIQKEGARFFREGVALLAGAARDVTLADLDGEGHLDLVLLNRDGNALTAILWQSSELGNRFLGSYQAILDATPLSMQLGHFTSPLEGAGAAFLDAAVLMPSQVGKPRVSVYASDPVIALPISPAGSTTVDLNSPKKLVVGNYDVRLNLPLDDSYKRPDDLIVTSDDTATDGDDPTAYALLFHEATHLSLSVSPVELPFGDKPAILATGDIDRDASDDAYKVNDAIYVSRVEPESGNDGKWILQTRLGQLNGTFLPKTINNEPIPVMDMEDERNPVAIVSFPMHRTLNNYVKKTPGLIDVIVANGGTGDLTVFVNKGLSVLTGKDEGSRDFALGGIPVDIAPGYLQSPVDGTAAPSAGTDQFSDIVALLSDKIVILYSLGASKLSQLGELVGYEPPVPLAFPGKIPVNVEVADMNGDGYMDIVVLDQDSSAVWIYVNLGKRRFSQPFMFDTGTLPVEMFVADVDADGCLDIVTADQTGKTLTSLRNMTATCRNF